MTQTGGRAKFPGFKDRNTWEKKRSILRGRYAPGGFVRWEGPDGEKDKFLVRLQKRPGKPDEFYRSQMVTGTPGDAREVLDRFFEQWLNGDVVCDKKVQRRKAKRSEPRLDVVRALDPKIEALDWDDVAGMPPLAGLVHAKYTREVITLSSPWVVWVGACERQLTLVPVGEMIRDGEGVVAEPIMHSILLFLEHRLERVAGRTVRRDVLRFQRIFARLRVDGIRWLVPRDLKVAMVESLALQQSNPASMKGTIVRWYGWCADNAFDGFDRRHLRRFEEITLPPQAAGMRGVRSDHPTKGALTFAEELRLQEALKDLSNPANLFDRIVVWLLYELGVRPSALLFLRPLDLTKTPGGQWRIRIRRVKQSRRRRAAYFQRPLTPELGELLSSLPQDQAYTLPGKRFWPNWGQRACRRFVEAVDLTSPRILRGGVEQELWLYPYRLRYSLATRLAEIGCSPETIAVMLDDETLAMALIYTENTSELVQVLAGTIDKHPAFRHHIGLFKGEIKEMNGQKLPLIPGGLPHLSGDEVGVIGHCSNPESCSLQPPLSCYRCPFFLADPDPGVHQQQFEQLTAHVRAQVGRESDRMAVVFQTDMYAIAEVIAQARGGRTLAQRMSGRISRGRV